MANIRIERKKIKKIDLINIPGGMTGAEVWKKYQPDVLMNLALYDGATNRNITHLIDEGEKSGYLFSDEGIGITNSSDIKWTTRHDTSVRDFVAGSPTLIKAGKVYIDWGNKHSSYVDGEHKRSIFGFNSTHLILCCTDNALTIEESAETAENLNMAYAVNLDGGGSQYLRTKEKTYKKSTRKNASWLLIYLKEEPKMKEVTETTVTHNGEELNAIIVDGVTYAPVRALAESLGKTVYYNAGTEKTTIT